MEKSRPEGITLAIVTYNAESHIRKTLEHIVNIRVESSVSWELLIVDNNSTDKTVDTINAFESALLKEKLRLVYEKRQGALYARLKAIQEAKFRILSFIDDDNWVSPNWIDEIYKTFSENPTIGWIASGSKGVYPINCSVNEHKESLLAVGEQYDQEGIVDSQRKGFWTAGSSICLNAFDRLFECGFRVCLVGREGDKPTGGEDREMCFALRLLGCDFYYSKQISFFHFIPEDRLRNDYLKSLIYNQAKSKPILDVYISALKKKSLWYPHVQVLISALFFLKFAFRHITADKRSFLDGNERLFLFYKGNLAGYYQNFSLYTRAYRNIRLIKKEKKKM